MTIIFQAQDYDPSVITRRTVEFSEVSGRKPWIVREYAEGQYKRAERVGNDAVAPAAQDYAKRLGCEVTLR